MQKLVSKGFVDDWLQVNYSQEFAGGKSMYSGCAEWVLGVCS